jgi:phosphoglycerol transferase
MKNLFIFLKRNKVTVFFLTAISLFFFLYFRNSAGIYPGLLDEFYYNQSARLLPLSEARYGNYFYYFIYRLTNVCGNGFLSCVYFLNAFFYTLAFIPIYLILSRLSNGYLSFIVAIYILLGPFNYWTAFFMPESLAFLCFWILVWFVLDPNIQDEKLRWAGVGAILGLSGLIKVHALLLSPAVIVFLILDDCSRYKYINFYRVLVKILLFLTSTVVIKLGIGFLIAGQSGLSLFGSYGNIGGVVEHAIGLSNNVNISKSDLDPKYTPFSLLRRDGVNAFLINFLPLFIFFGASVCLVIDKFINGLRAIKEREQHVIPSHINLHFLTFIIVSSLISGITAYQLIQIASGDGNAELYWRYYEYSFLLFYVCSAWALKNDNNKSQPSAQRILIGLFVLVFTTWAVARGYGNEFIDANKNSKIYFFISFISIFASLVWIINARLGIKVFLFILAPSFIIFSNIQIFNVYKVTRFFPNESGVGMYLSSRLSIDDLNKLVIVQDTHLTQTVPLIYLNKALIPMVGISPDQYKFNLDELPVGKDWVILMGNHELTGKRLSETHMDYFSFGGVTIFGGHGEIFLDFKRSEWRGSINKISGLYNPPEPWGAWSISRKVKFEFAKPLPRKFDLIMNARAYGPNLKKDFVIKLGDREARFKVNSFPEFKLIAVSIENPARLNCFEIMVPKPTSPRSYINGEDDRELGIGLQYLKVSW